MPGRDSSDRFDADDLNELAEVARNLRRLWSQLDAISEAVVSLGEGLIEDAQDLLDDYDDEPDEEDNDETEEPETGRFTRRDPVWDTFAAAHDLTPETKALLLGEDVVLDAVRREVEYGQRTGWSPTCGTGQVAFTLAGVDPPPRWVTARLAIVLGRLADRGDVVRLRPTHRGERLAWTLPGVELSDRERGRYRRS